MAVTGSRQSNMDNGGEDLRPFAETGSEEAGGQFSSQEVRELVKLVSDNGITELLIERDHGAQRLLIKRDHPAPAPVVMASQPLTAAGHAVARDVPLAMSAAPAPGSVIPDPGSPPVEAYQKVSAPMVGTFYRSPDPKDSPFVKEGDMVEKDQVIGIIEAMKIMNEIKSDFSGRCVRFAVENGQPVEYGQTLMLIEPA
ncbi:MAG TPA: acetyl-CoA carboxylase biotin carboxyl carrier protein [Chloroflexia bacterium]|nr:acetyl-CoA carboxylase biotin carboxyl carrier protein [Chloroflexia bacterium]